MSDVESVRGPLLCPFETDTEVGSFIILEQIGRRTGQAWLYRAKEKATGRIVVLKVPRPETVQSDPEAFDRLKNEAALLYELQGPLVPKYYYFGTIPDELRCGGYPYIVMEYIDGDELGVWVRHTRDLKKIFVVFEQLLRILSELHDKGYYYFDISLRNAIITKEDTLKLIDLGLAGRSITAMSKPKPSHGDWRGTLQFGDPKVIEGEEPPTRRSDTYSVCRMLREVLETAQIKESDAVKEVLDSGIKQRKYSHAKELLDALRRATVSSPAWSIRLTRLLTIATVLGATLAGFYWWKSHISKSSWPDTPPLSPESLAKKVTRGIPKNPSDLYERDLRFLMSSQLPKHRPISGKTTSTERENMKIAHQVFLQSAGDSIRMKKFLVPRNARQYIDTSFGGSKVYPSVWFFVAGSDGKFNVVRSNEEERGKWPLIWREENQTACLLAVYESSTFHAFLQEDSNGKRHNLSGDLVGVEVDDLANEIEQFHYTFGLVSDWPIGLENVYENIYADFAPAAYYLPNSRWSIKKDNFPRYLRREFGDCIESARDLHKQAGEEPEQTLLEKAEQVWNRMIETSSESVQWTGVVIHRATRDLILELGTRPVPAR